MPSETSIATYEPMYSAAYIQRILLAISRGTYTIAYLLTQSSAHVTSVSEV